MTRQFSSGRDDRSRALVETALPIGLDAAAMPGARVLGTDGRVYESIKWPTSSDPYSWQSASDIAEDVAADVARILSPGFLITVSNTGPAVPGSHYTSINEAIKYASSFIRSHTPEGSRVGWIKLLSGYKMDEQVILRGVDCRNIAIVAEDLVVQVDVSTLTTQTDIDILATTEYGHAAWVAQEGSLPQFLGVIFEPDGPDTDIPQDPVRVAQTGAYTPRSYGFSAQGGAFANLQFRDRDEDFNLITRRPVGFRGFWLNGRGGENSAVRLFGANLSNGVGGAARFLGTTNIRSVTATGGGTLGFRVANSAAFVGAESGADALFPGVFGQDFRRTDGVDDPGDIIVEAGIVVVRALAANFRGGFNIPLNTVRSNAIVLASGRVERTYHRDNILGTVSQASGVPTGAIIERGSNSNGEFVRFADGTQICWRDVTVSLTIETAFLGGFRSGGQTWTYPAAFSAVPAMVGTPIGLTCFSVVGTTNSPTATEALWAATAVTSQTSAPRRVQQIAIGRWF